MSLCHCSALEEIGGAEARLASYPLIDLGGLDQSTLVWLVECKDKLYFNSVEVIIHMIQTLVVHNQDNGGILIPPPILSRVFQTLSRGQVILATCKKITVTLFPFPFAQPIKVFQLIVAVAAPIVMSGLCNGSWHWAFFFTFCPVFGLVAMNTAAGELEWPFGQDPNDLPLHQFQDQFNTALMMLIHKEADHIPHTSSSVSFDFDESRRKPRPPGREPM